MSSSHHTCTNIQQYHNYMTRGCVTVDQMNAQSLVLAQLATQYGVDTQHGKDPDAAAAQAIKAQLIQAQRDLARITAQKAQADEDTATARKLADQYQPMIIDAEKAKRGSDFHFQEFAHLTHQVRVVACLCPFVQVQVLVLTCLSRRASAGSYMSRRAVLVRTCLVRRASAGSQTFVEACYCSFTHVCRGVLVLVNT